MWVIIWIGKCQWNRFDTFCDEFKCDIGLKDYALVFCDFFKWDCYWMMLINIREKKTIEMFRKEKYHEPSAISFVCLSKAFSVKVWIFSSICMLIIKLTLSFDHHWNLFTWKYFRFDHTKLTTEVVKKHHLNNFTIKV